MTETRKPKTRVAVLISGSGTNMASLIAAGQAADAPYEVVVVISNVADVTGLEKARAEEEFLRHAVKELDDFAPEPGEDARLDAARRTMQAAERIQGDVARAMQALGPDGAEGAMIDAGRWLDGAAEKAEGRLDAAERL